MLPEYFRNYTSIFSSKKAGRLALYKSYNYTIELKEGEPFYSPFYNLLTIELAVLRRYLNDNLTKN